MGFYSENVSALMIMLWTFNATAAVEAAQYTFYTIDGHLLEYQKDSWWTSSEPRFSSGQYYNSLAPGFSPEYSAGSAIRIKIGMETGGRFTTIEDDDDRFSRFAEDGNQIIKKYGYATYHIQVENAGHTDINLQCTGQKGKHPCTQVNRKRIFRCWPYRVCVFLFRRVP